VSVLDRPLDGAGGSVLDLLPFRALEADAREAAVLGVDDAAVLVVPRVLLVLAQDRKLHAIDRLKLAK